MRPYEIFWLLETINPPKESTRKSLIEKMDMESTKDYTIDDWCELLEIKRP